MVQIVLIIHSIVTLSRRQINWKILSNFWSILEKLYKWYPQQLWWCFRTYLLYNSSLYKATRNTFWAQLKFDCANLEPWWYVVCAALVYKHIRCGEQIIRTVKKWPKINKDGQKWTIIHNWGQIFFDRTFLIQLCFDKTSSIFIWLRMNFLSLNRLLNSTL